MVLCCSNFPGRFWLNRLLLSHVLYRKIPQRANRASSRDRVMILILGCFFNVRKHQYWNWFKVLLGIKNSHIVKVFWFFTILSIVVYCFLSSKNWRKINLSKMFKDMVVISFGSCLSLHQGGKILKIMRFQTPIKYLIFNNEK